MNIDNNPTAQTGVSITTWREDYAEHFAALNRDWITRFFRLEPSDLKILGNPKGEIIDKGGQIFFAVRGNDVVGCCALVHHPDTGRYELAKMAVSPAAQGLGIGTLLGRTLMKYAGANGVDSIYLEANTRLTASVKLYYSLGFKKVEMDSPVYERCDLYMEARVQQATP
jgi:ribosomal protein S18 acetylase RimI-like enzyme